MKITRHAASMTHVFLLVAALIGITIAGASARSVNTDLTKLTKGDVVRMKTNLKHERELQNSVDHGHQPWRFEAKDVAFSQVASDPKATYDRCQVVHESQTKAQVRCEGTHRYLVQLRRLVRPDGIWTATSITVEGAVEGTENQRKMDSGSSPE